MKLNHILFAMKPSHRFSLNENGEPTVLCASRTNKLNSYFCVVVLKYICYLKWFSCKENS